jgi:hypothetical protein
MLKTWKVTALVCGLLIMHGQREHAVRQLVYAAGSIPWNGKEALVTGGHMLFIETSTKPALAEFRGGTIPPFSIASDARASG